MLHCHPVTTKRSCRLWCSPPRTAGEVMSTHTQVSHEPKVKSWSRIVQCQFHAMVLISSTASCYAPRPHIFFAQMGEISHACTPAESASPDWLQSSCSPRHAESSHAHHCLRWSQAESAQPCKLPWRLCSSACRLTPGRRTCTCLHRG